MNLPEGLVAVIKRDCPGWRSITPTKINVPITFWMPRIIVMKPFNFGPCVRPRPPRSVTAPSLAVKISKLGGSAPKIVMNRMVIIFEDREIR